MNLYDWEKLEVRFARIEAFIQALAHAQGLEFDLEKGEFTPIKK